MDPRPRADRDAFRNGASLLILVNPVNPTGTVFTRDQLEPLVGIVDRYGGRVWADEVHAPLIYDRRRHVPYASLSETAAAHTVTAASGCTVCTPATVET